MKKFLKYSFIFLFASVLIFGAVSALAVESGTATSTSSTSIEVLQLTVEALKAQLDLLIKQLAQLTQNSSTPSNTTSTIQFATTSIAISTSTTGRWCHNFDFNLRPQDKGEEVKFLQIALEREGFSISQEEKNNSFFGTSTSAAAKEFQKKYHYDILGYHNLSLPTGLVFSRTRMIINELYSCDIPNLPILNFLPSGPGKGSVLQSGKEYEFFIEITNAMPSSTVVLNIYKTSQSSNNKLISDSNVESYIAGRTDDQGKISFQRKISPPFVSVTTNSGALHIWVSVNNFVSKPVYIPVLPHVSGYYWSYDEVFGKSEWRCRENRVGPQVWEGNCKDPKPTSTPITYSYSWKTENWSVCSVNCGGEQSRRVWCERNDGKVVDSGCSSHQKPADLQPCNIQACQNDNNTNANNSWVSDDWSVCSASCGGGAQTRNVWCKKSDGTKAEDNNCAGSKPSMSQSCNAQQCVSVDDDISSLTPTYWSEKWPTSHNIQRVFDIKNPVCPNQWYTVSKNNFSLPTNTKFVTGTVGDDSTLYLDYGDDTGYVYPSGNIMVTLSANGKKCTGENKIGAKSSATCTINFSTPLVNIVDAQIEAAFMASSTIMTACTKAGQTSQINYDISCNGICGIFAEYGAAVYGATVPPSKTIPSTSSSGGSNTNIKDIDKTFTTVTVIGTGGIVPPTQTTYDSLNQSLNDLKNTINKVFGF